MYVRWRQEMGTANSAGVRPCKAWYARVVENKRIDGKPRQRVVKYLGGIREYSRASAYRQNEFWQKVTPLLDALALPAEQREHIEAQLVGVVPRPTPEEVERD